MCLNYFFQQCTIKFSHKEKQKELHSESLLVCLDYYYLYLLKMQNTSVTTFSKPTFQLKKKKINYKTKKHTKYLVPKCLSCSVESVCSYIMDKN